MQTLSPEILAQAPNVQAEEVIPALQDTKYYFALVEHGGRKILCILDGEKWRPTSYDEMLRLTQ